MVRVDQLVVRGVNLGEVRSIQAFDQNLHTEDVDFSTSLLRADLEDSCRHRGADAHTFGASDSLDQRHCADDDIHVVTIFRICAESQVARVVIYGLGLTGVGGLVGVLGGLFDDHDLGGRDRHIDVHDRRLLRATEEGEDKDGDDRVELGHF